MNTPTYLQRTPPPPPGQSSLLQLLFLPISFPSPALERPLSDLPWRSQRANAGLPFCCSAKKLTAFSCFLNCVVVLSLKGLLCRRKPEPPSQQSLSIPSSSHLKKQPRSRQSKPSSTLFFNLAPFLLAQFVDGDLLSPGSISLAPFPTGQPMGLPLLCLLFRSAVTPFPPGLLGSG